MARTNGLPDFVRAVGSDAQRRRLLLLPSPFERHQDPPILRRGLKRRRPVAPGPADAQHHLVLLDLEEGPKGPSSRRGCETGPLPGGRPSARPRTACSPPRSRRPGQDPLAVGGVVVDRVLREPHLRAVLKPPHELPPPDELGGVLGGSLLGAASQGQGGEQHRRGHDRSSGRLPFGLSTFLPGHCNHDD